jgi:hypothetical protein
MPNPFFDVLDREIARHFSKEAAGFVHAVFSLNDPQELRDLLNTAGFDPQKVSPHTRQVQLPAAREFMWQYIYCTPLMSLLTESGAANTDALERAVVAGWQPWVADHGMRYEQSVLAASARRPG